MNEFVSIDEAGAMLGLTPARIRSLLRSAQGREQLPLISTDPYAPEDGRRDLRKFYTDVFSIP